MKRYAKIVQVDSRGQVVIPKDVRRELNIAEGGGFFMYVIENEGILLKRVNEEELADSHIIKKIEIDGPKIGIKKENIVLTKEGYKKVKSGTLQDIT